MAGRPTKFRLPLAAEICLKMITENPPNNNVKKICAANSKYPCFKTFYSWLFKANQEDSADEFKEFLHQYNRAIEIRADIYNDEQVNIAYDDKGDILVGLQGMRGNSTNVARSKLKIDTIQYLLKVSNPKKYGDRNATDLTIKSNGAACDALQKITESYMNKEKG
jgi:predicted RNA-binding protein Jag